MADIVLRNCNIVHQQELSDIEIGNGKIVAIKPAKARKSKAGKPRQELDCQGLLVTPPFIDCHIHLDSVLTAGDPRPNESGTLFEGIQIWGERKNRLVKEEVKCRARQALELLAQHGVLYVRTHVDVTEAKLIALDALLELREEVRDWITVQVVAFPQDGIYSKPQNEGLMAEAVMRGVDVIGGIPHYELTHEDGVRSIGRIFDLAEQYDRLIDIHCDEIDDEQSRFLEVVTAQAIRRGMGEKVSASHTTAFGSYNDAYAYKLMGFLRQAQINFISNPLINITLQGRLDTYPKRRGVTRIKELWQNGINVSLGQDCIADPWYVLGTGSMLGVAHMAVHVAQMTGMKELEGCFDMASSNGARTLHLGDYGIAVGNLANLAILEAPSMLDSIRYQAAPRYVISRGRLISHTRPAQTEFKAHGIFTAN